MEISDIARNLVSKFELFRLDFKEQPNTLHLSPVFNKTSIDLMKNSSLRKLVPIVLFKG
jgi:hypothetical protein